MLVVSLLILSVCMGVTLLSIHTHDEIHRIVAFLCILITLICTFILTHVTIKILVSLLCIIFINRMSSNNGYLK